MNIIDQFVISLEENKLEEMKQKLYALGERHQIYRAKKSYFVVINYSKIKIFYFLFYFIVKIK